MFVYRSTAVELLAHNDDPATRDLLLRLLSTDSDTDVVSAALASARKLWGEASLDPDYALLQNPEAESVDDVEDLLKRVCERGEPRRLFEVLAHSPADIQEPIATSLLNRPVPPLAEAEAAIGSNEPRTARLAAQILGRAGTKAAGAGKGLETALQRWQSIWDERRRQMIQRNQRDEDLGNKITPCLQSLVWAAGRLGVGRDALLTASARGDDPLYRPVRLGAMSDPVLAALEAAALGGDPEIRTLAVDALSRRDARRAARLAEKVLQDRTSFNRLAGRDPAAVAGTLRTAAGQVHYQGVALPHLIARGDVEGLSAVAADRRLPEATRLGAIEGLARLGGDAAAAKLVEIGKADKEEEELRKAAWRGLRRLQRERQRPRKKAAEVKR
jgi:ParB family transcriptional regulator, chromosome partitioning protein